MCVGYESSHLNRWRFTQSSVLQLLSALLKLIYTSSGGSPTVSEPSQFVTLETVHDMVWSHTEFLTVMCSSHDQPTTAKLASTKGSTFNLSLKFIVYACTLLSLAWMSYIYHPESLAELLIALVQLQPLICQSAHIAVLLSAYSATLSKTGECVKPFMHTCM